MLNLASMIVRAASISAISNESAGSIRLMIPLRVVRWSIGGGKEGGFGDGRVLTVKLAKTSGILLAAATRILVALI